MFFSYIYFLASHTDIHAVFTPLLIHTYLIRKMQIERKRNIFIIFLPLNLGRSKSELFLH